MSDDRTQPTSGDPASSSRRDDTTSAAGSGTGTGTGSSATRPDSTSPSRPDGTSSSRSDSTRQTPAVGSQTTREPEVVVEAPDRASIVARQKAAFGGVKPFVAFFGWLTATGMLVLLTALLGAVGASVSQVVSPSEAVQAVQGTDAETLTWIGVVVILVLVFVSYYAGGYVAGRMARFDGMRQGVAVWLWAVVIAVALGVLGYFFNTDNTVLSSINSIQLPTSGLSTQALVGLIGLVVASLVGAVLGGLAGMHFHRKVDLAGLGR